MLLQQAGWFPGWHRVQALTPNFSDEQPWLTVRVSQSNVTSLPYESAGSIGSGSEAWFAAKVISVPEATFTWLALALTWLAVMFNAYPIMRKLI